MDGENYAYNEESAQNEFQPDGENYQLQEQSYDPNGSGQAYSAPITSTAAAGMYKFKKYRVISRKNLNTTQCTPP